MQRFVPDYVFDTIYEITPLFLQEHGIQGVLIDLDGTLASRKTPLPPDGLADFLRELQENGLKVMIFSNNREKRVERFCQTLHIPFISRARKPFLRGFHLAMKKLNLPPQALAIIGDQIFTDVLGGNRVGALTCYVHPVDWHDFLIRARCHVERVFVKCGEKSKQKRGL